MSNTDRIQYLKDYFAKEEKVKVEIPVHISDTSKGQVHRYFNGERCGYKFKNGWAAVDRKDLHKFQGRRPFIIHDESEDTN